MTTCSECDGRGEIVDSPGNALDGRAWVETCPCCGGSGLAPEQDQEFVERTLALVRHQLESAARNRQRVHVSADFSERQPIDVTRLEPPEEPGPDGGTEIRIVIDPKPRLSKP